MENNLKIRDCTIDDAASIAAIYNESILAGNATMDDEPKTVAEVRQWIEKFKDRETILMLESRTKVIGWGIIKRYSDRSGYRYACETAVYLRHRHVRKGYGSLIKKALIDRCRQFGYHHLVAKIFASNTASIEYNKKLGYEIVGRQKEIGIKNGRWQDSVIMQLVLADVMPDDLIEK